MASVYDPKAFTARVRYAALFIQSGRATGRTFDTCFEMSDGHAVAAALATWAQKNAKLREMMPRYITLDFPETQALIGKPFREIAAAAARMRDRSA